MLELWFKRKISKFLKREIEVTSFIRDILHKKQQQKKAVAEVEECTFTPKTISSPSRREDIISKTKKWEAERENKLVKNEMAIIEKEMSACTFYPNNMLETASPGSHTFSNFFQRNTEWRKTKETKNKIREEKAYSSIMVGRIIEYLSQFSIRHHQRLRIQERHL